MRRVLSVLVLAAICLAEPADAAPAGAAGPELDSIDQRLLPCASCHGEEGRATSDGYFPRIAGKPAGYLYHQLINFRDGRRHNAQMRYMLERQTDVYLREMAQYFADLKLPYPPPQAPGADARTLERGRMLTVAGDPSLQVPACQRCHGERLTGVAPDAPGLLGLPYDYLVAQFGGWREGSRRTVPPDCMAEIARRLSLADIAAVAAWLASQPLPADAAPAAAFTELPPMTCGSIDAMTGAQP